MSRIPDNRELITLAQPVLITRAVDRGFQRFSILAFQLFTEAPSLREPERTQSKRTRQPRARLGNNYRNIIKL
jgi:hypothetical protein